MYDLEKRKNALRLVAQGRSLNSVSEETGVSRWAIRSWQTRIEPLPRILPPQPCARCTPGEVLLDEEAYAYVLGLYLGDGCLSRHPRGSGLFLRIACAKAWPGLVEEYRRAILAVRPDRNVHFIDRPGDVLVTSYGRHWTCLFPQHGEGKKHDRRILLEPWQQETVDRHPWPFIRGLIHSDGCRITNWTVRTVAGERKR